MSLSGIHLTGFLASFYAGSHLGDRGEAFVRERFESGRGDADADPAVLFGNEDALLLQVGQPAAARVPVGMRDVRAVQRSDAGQITSVGHCEISFGIAASGRAES